MCTTALHQNAVKRNIKGLESDYQGTVFHLARALFSWLLYFLLIVYKYMSMLDNEENP